MALSKRLPPWFKIRLATNKQYAAVRNLVTKNQLHTVCQSAACPNQHECWNAGTATFMILGNVCTRGCRFCNVPKGRPVDVDMREPERVADAVATLQLQYAVITSVTRDDLADGGAGVFAATIRAIRERTPACPVEVLVPDFQGSREALQIVLDAHPGVLNHNIETVPSLYSSVRPKADYQRSLDLLKSAKSAGAATKSGMMLGLGEGAEEVFSVMTDLSRAGCDILTLGQYLRPNNAALPVMKYYRPEEFDAFRVRALSMGFRRVVAGPLVRSSYEANSSLFDTGEIV